MDRLKCVDDDLLEFLFDNFLVDVLAMLVDKYFLEFFDEHHVAVNLVHRGGLVGVLCNRIIGKM